MPYGWWGHHHETWLLNCRRTQCWFWIIFSVLRWIKCVLVYCWVLSCPLTSYVISNLSELYTLFIKHLKSEGMLIILPCLADWSLPPLCSCKLIYFIIFIGEGDTPYGIVILKCSLLVHSLLGDVKHWQQPTESHSCTHAQQHHHTLFTVMKAHKCCNTDEAEQHVCAVN